jgi:hypothetical protein
VQIDDPALDSGEWLFKRSGKVFGPVPSRQVAQLLYKGELDAETPISIGDGAWIPIGDVPAFIVHARKAEAARRVEREVTGARALRARRRRRGLVAGAIALLLAMAGGGYAAWVLAAREPARNALLEDFGSGIRIAVAARIGASQRAREEEIAVAFDHPAPGRPAPRKARPAAAGGAPAGGAEAARGSAEGGDLVAAQYDPARIQAVLSREQRTLAECFKAEAGRSPDFAGNIPLEFAIGNDGRVAQLWIDEPRFKAGPLRDCLLKKLGAWRFDPFPGQRPTVALTFGIGR